MGLWSISPCQVSSKHRASWWGNNAYLCFRRHHIFREYVLSHSRCSTWETHIQKLPLWDILNVREREVLNQRRRWPRLLWASNSTEFKQSMTIISIWWRAVQMQNDSPLKALQIFREVRSTLNVRKYVRKYCIFFSIQLFWLVVHPKECKFFCARCRTKKVVCSMDLGAALASTDSSAHKYKILLWLEHLGISTVSSEDSHNFSN